jgi:hypothetical protein
MLKEDDPTWRFVAMEYHAVIFNRTFVVTVTSTQICRARVRGLLASPPEPDPECPDPDLYTTARLVDGVDIASEAYYRLDGSDFQISLAELERVRFDTSPKRGNRDRASLRYALFRPAVRYDAGVRADWYPGWNDDMRAPCRNQLGVLGPANHWVERGRGGPRLSPKT